MLAYNGLGLSGLDSVGETNPSDGSGGSILTGLVVIQTRSTLD
jgi:hypothetical protein